MVRTKHSVVGASRLSGFAGVPSPAKGVRPSSCNAPSSQDHCDRYAALYYCMLSSLGFPCVIYRYVVPQIPSFFYFLPLVLHVCPRPIFFLAFSFPCRMNVCLTNRGVFLLFLCSGFPSAVLIFGLRTYSSRRRTHVDLFLFISCVAIVNCVYPSLPIKSVVSLYNDLHIVYSCMRVTCVCSYTAQGCEERLSLTL